MKELELIDKFCKVLDGLNLPYKRELRRGSWHNQGYIDIVIFAGTFIAIEAKVSNFRQVISQAAGDHGYVPYSYVLYPKMPSKKGLERIREYGIGLIILDRGQFKVIKPSNRSTFLFSGCYKKIKRNWKENRIGRPITQKEIPDHYTKEQIEKLKPKYEWTKQ